MIWGESSSSRTGYAKNTLETKAIECTDINRRGVARRLNNLHAIAQQDLLLDL